MSVISDRDSLENDNGDFGLREGLNVSCTACLARYFQKNNTLPVFHFSEDIFDIHQRVKSQEKGNTLQR